MIDEPDGKPTKKLGARRCLLLTSISLAWPLHAEIPTAEQIADSLGLSAADGKSVLAGNMVSRTVKSTNERELTVSLVFLVTLSVEQLKAEADRKLLTTTDPGTIAWSPIAGDGSLDDFDTLSLDPEPNDRAKAYLNAKPGEGLNPDQAEITAFNGVTPSAGGSEPDAVTDAVKNQLLDRFRS